MLFIKEKTIDLFDTGNYHKKSNLKYKERASFFHFRGLDSDEKRVTLTELRFSRADLMIGLLGALMIALMMVIQKIY